MAFAQNTSVSVEQTRAEIERTLMRYGASAFGYGWEDERAIVQFRAKDRHIKFMLSLPAMSEKRFTHSSAGPREPDVARKQWEQACRSRWRALLLIIKAKLEAVASGIVEFETEFMPHVVMPDGRTVAEHARPQIKIAYERKEMQRLLPDYSAGAAQ